MDRTKKVLIGKPAFADAVSTAASARSEERSSKAKRPSPSLELAEGTRGAGLVRHREICSPPEAVFPAWQPPEGAVKTDSGDWFVRDHKTGDMRHVRTPDQARRESYALQSVAREALWQTDHPKQVAGGKHKHWSVNYCIRGSSFMDAGTQVQVLRSNTTGRAKFSGLAVCGSVWTCAICADKVTEFRKTEILEASQVHHAAGGACYMVTLTFPHQRADRLSELMEGFRAALRRMRSRDRYRDLLDSIDYLGLVRAIEVTWGRSNGWHPHAHELWMTTRKLAAAELVVWRETLYELWSNACRSAGLSIPTAKHGVHIRTADEGLAEYLAKWGKDPKWGASKELTKAHLKRGGDRFTPFDFLRAIKDGEAQYVSQFGEFARGMFGVRQCFWSRGLKALFGIRDLTDEQIAEADEVPHSFVANLDRLQWLRVIYGRRDHRASVLEAAERGGADAVSSIIASLPSTPPELATLGAASPGVHAALLDVPAHTPRPPISPRGATAALQHVQSTCMQPETVLGLHARS